MAKRPATPPQIIITKHHRNNPHHRRPRAADWFAEDYQPKEPELQLFPFDQHRDEEDPSGDNGIYFPIEVNGMRFKALLDTGAQTSAVSLSAVSMLGVKDEVANIDPGEPASIRTFHPGINIPRIGRLRCSLACGERELECDLEVIECEDHFIVGRDIMPLLGIAITGLPSQWPASKSDRKERQQADEMEDGLREQAATPWGLEDRIQPPSEFEHLQNDIAKAINANQKLDPSKPACPTIEGAKLRLPFELDVEGIFRHQYAIPGAAKSTIDETVAKWARDGVIEPGSAGSTFNAPILAAPKKDPSSHGQENSMADLP